MAVSDFEDRVVERLGDVESAVRTNGDLLRTFQDGLARDMATIVQDLGRVADALERLAEKADPS